MDRRTLLAVFLCLMVYYGWFVLRGPRPEAGADGGADGGIAAADDPAPAPGSTPTRSPRPVPASADLPIRDVAFAACDAQGTWSTDGGGLRSVKLLAHEEPYHITMLYTWALGLVTGGDSDWRPYGDDPGPISVVSEAGSAMALGAGEGTARTRMRVVEEGAGRVVLEGVTAEGIELRQEIQASGSEPCVFDLIASWRNPGPQPYAGPLWLGVHDVLAEAPGGLFGNYASVTSAQAFVGGDVHQAAPSDVEETPTPLEGEVGWFGLADRYFGLLVIPEDLGGTLSFTRSPPAGGAAATSVGGAAPGEVVAIGATHEVATGLAAGGSHHAHYRAYAGPLSTERLEAVDAALGLSDRALVEVVNYGWFSFFAYPLLWLLKIFHAGVGNWGAAILLLTFSVKAVFFPLTQSAFKSGQAMQAIQPELQEIKEKYKDNNEEQNRKMMELFQRNGVNPVGGCLPMLVQFPVWIALYNVLLSTVDLYHTEFLYLLDLSSPDPYCALPVIVIVLMVIQQQFTPMGNMDPAQARMMKVMPVMFGIFFFVLPSGLVLYIFMNMLLSVLQQWLIKRNWQNPQAVTAGSRTSPTTGS